MSLSRKKKETVVSEVADKLSGAQAAILARYKGLTVGQISDLRREARNNEVDVLVVKNTLARLSVSNSPFDCLSDHFVGPVLVSSSHDPAVLAKVVSEFAKSNDAFEITVGSMNGELIDKETISRLASLPSRNELLTQLAATLRAPLDMFARVLNEMPSRLARAVVAVRNNQEIAQG
jgi:large subunit ribosomal protein L10